MRVMTYNIRLGVESSLAEIAADIEVAGIPDVLALQEVGDHWRMGEKVDQAEAIAQALGLTFHTFAGALTDDEGGRYGIALASAWPLEEVQVFELPVDADEQRVCLLAKTNEVWVLNTHLSIETAERGSQAVVVGELAQKLLEPVLVMGDLNDQPGSATVRLVRGGLTDCFDASGEGPEVTFSVEDPQRRIDYIFCGGGIAPSGPCRVVREAAASDHFPLVAEVA